MNQSIELFTSITYKIGPELRRYFVGHLTDDVFLFLGYRSRSATEKCNVQADRNKEP